MPAAFRIGVDLGGTKIEAAALDRAGAMHGRRRVMTPSGDYQAAIAMIVDLVSGIEHDLDARATVGIGMPGAISAPSGLVKNANSTWLNGRPLGRDLEAVLGRPVRLANDANCFALSEATDGAAAGLATVFGAILGTGVGGGIVVSGHILAGANAIAGEWGHTPLPWPGPDELPGPPCYCGRRGCVETFLSGPGLAADHRRHTGQTFAAKEVAAAAEAGDPAALITMERYAERLARGLAIVIDLFDPDAIVLGGGLSAIARLYDRVPKLWPRWIFSDLVNTRLLAPLHGAASGVRGAAWLWPPDAPP